jgi:hypothetical protein
MPEYEWKRLVKIAPATEGAPATHKYEYKTTKTLRKPKGEWTRVYSFGVGTVPGAGGSPARTVRRQHGSS